MEEPMELDGQTYWTGFTEEYVRYAVKSDEDLHNRFVRGKAERFLNDEIMLMETYELEK